MNQKDIDPKYYQDNDDGSEPHGYWIKDANYERRQIELKRKAKIERDLPPTVQPF